MRRTLFATLAFLSIASTAHAWPTIGVRLALLDAAREASGAKPGTTPTTTATIKARVPARFSSNTTLIVGRARFTQPSTSTTNQIESVETTRFSMTQK